MRSRLVIALIAAGLLAASAQPARAATGKGDLIAFRDTNSAQTAEQIKSTTLPVLQAGCSGIAVSHPGSTAQVTLPPGVNLPPGVTLPPGTQVPSAKKAPRKRAPSFAAALGSAERVAAGRGTRKVLKKLRRGAQLRREGGAHEVMVAAILAGSPRLALGALLTANKRDPRDRMNLVNAAVPLAILGRPDDALALLQKALRMKGPLPKVGGVPGAAVMHNNVGFVQMKLGQTDSAIASYRKALAGGPALAEAHAGLGSALACKGKADEAAEHIHASLARQNLVRVDSAAPLAPAGLALARVDPPALGRAAASSEPQLPIASDVLDLSKGVEGKLPPVPIPTTPGQALKAKAVLQSLREQNGASLDQIRSQRRQAEAKDEADLNRGSIATTKRRASIENLVYTTDTEPRIGNLHDQARAAEKPVYEYTKQFWDTVTGKHAECLTTTDHDACFVPWCQEALTSAMGTYRSRVQDLDGKVRAWWAAAGFRETAVTANISDGPVHDITMAATRLDAGIAYGTLIAAQEDWMSRVDGWKQWCVAGQEQPPPEQGAVPSVDDPGACTGELARKLSGSLKTDVDIPPGAGKEKATKVGVSLKVACEKVEVELSHKVAGTGDLLSVFGKGEADFKRDSVTMVVGVKGSVAGLAQGQSGIYVTMGNNGVKDFGWRVGASGSADPFGGLSGTSPGVKVWGGSENISLVGAIDNIPAAFGF